MPITPSNNPAFSNTLDELTTSSVAHPDTWNPVHQALLDNTEHLRLRAGETAEAVDALQARIEGVEKISAVDVSRSVSLDWLYRGNRIAIEFFTDATTLVAHAGVAVVSGIAGDDSIDLAGTAGFAPRCLFLVCLSGGVGLFLLGRVLCLDVCHLQC